MAAVLSDYVKNVRGLMIGRNADFGEIARLCDEFVEIAPYLAETLQKQSLNISKINKELPASIKNAVEKLDGVKAMWLKNDGDTLLRVTGAQFNAEMCRKLLPPFVANILSLSINMQTAKNSYLSAFVSESDIEVMGDVVKNLHAVRDLINDSKFAHAAEILEDMSFLDNDENARELIKELKANNGGGNLIGLLIDTYAVKTKEMTKESTIVQHSIMLVDDRPEILETVGGYLRDSYKIFPLTKGTIALKAIEKQKIDLFILDIDMPDMDGITLAKKIREQPAYARTPIIILTSNASREYVLAAMQAGANDFLIKPANRDILILKIADFIKTAEALAAK